MSAAPLADLDAALAGGASPLVVLAFVDSLIERADARTLAALADRLDAVAAERGGEWEMLARARPSRDTVFAGWWARIGALVLLLMP
jgi:hypothetical protein